MAYFIIGTNHEKADTQFSSLVAFSNEKMSQLHHDLLQLNLADCALIVSTCNRSEVYVYKRQVDNIHKWTEEISSLVLYLHKLDSDNLDKFYLKVNQEACLHLFKVACGLDSLVLGEPQITGQIKAAMNFTEQFYAVGNIKIPAEFHRLLAETFACAKEVRTRTSIGKYAVSIAYMACKIARNILPNSLAAIKIVLVGASQTNLLLARHLVQNGLHDLHIVNRTYNNAENFIHELGFGKAYTFDQLPEVLNDATLVFSSTSADNHIISHEMIKQLQEQRANQQFIFFDLAIPNDIDPKISEINGVHLYNRDNLQHLVEENKHKRKLAVDDAFPILQKYLNQYQEQNRILQGNDIIVAYRNAVNQQRNTLLEEAKLALSRGEDVNQILDTLANNLTNKILHTPTLMMSAMIKNGQACELKNLEEFVDRGTKQTMQSVVSGTLEKDVFKVSCCKHNSEIKACSQNLLQISEPSNDFTNKVSLSVSSINTPLPEQQLDLIHIENKGDISKCPFHANKGMVNHSEQVSVNNVSDKLTSNLSRWEDTVGIFVPLNYEYANQQEMLTLTDLLDNKEYPALNDKAYIIEAVNNTQDPSLGKVKFTSSKNN